MKVYEQIVETVKQRPMLALLVDPDKCSDAKDIERIAEAVNAADVDLVLVGGSLIFSSIDSTVKELKGRLKNCPVVVFPGLSSHFSSSADAILFLSLLSGRNPEFLIGNQVHAAIPVKRSGVEVIPTAYILVDGGRTTSVEYMSNTMPIPSDKPDIALATAVAAELLGFKMIYLEAGSGAFCRVPSKMIKLIKESVGLPLVVGGGIKTEADLQEVLSAGADVVVVGTAFEDNITLISKFGQLVRNHKM